MFANAQTIRWLIRIIQPILPAVGRTARPGHLMHSLRHTLFGLSVASLLGIGVRGMAPTG